MHESQQRTRAFLFRDSPVIGFLFLYALSFLVFCAFLDVWELFDPGKGQLDKLPLRYLLPLANMFPFWHTARRLEKKRSLEV
jgi:hypothetical protein